MIVVNMNMPKNCSSCELSNITACPIFYRYAAESGKGRLNDCPIKCDIEDIRAEIEEYKDDKIIHAECNEMIDIVLDIIDKHIKGEQGWDAMRAIASGTPIPDNATNGDVIKAMFDVKETDMSNTYCVRFPNELADDAHYFFKDWWNAPYQKGNTNG